MKSITLVLLVLLSLPSFADYCSNKKPTENYFDTQYVLDYIFAPNWDDLCFEQDSKEEMQPCYAEAEQWVEWFQCREKTKVERTLSCSVQGIDVVSTEIEDVKINILKDGLAVDYKYSRIAKYFFDIADNSTPANVYDISEDKIIFNLDGETFGKLASFDNGKSFEGRAVISQDFPVFLTCK
jgi:hypothetical protein